MVSIRPVHRALVPVDSDAAYKLSSPNYDEFQGDREIWDMLQARPDNVLRVTMAHCDATRFDDVIEEGSDEALARSTANMQALLDSPLATIADDVLFLYEVVSPRRPDVRQIGLGGVAGTAEIRTLLAKFGIGTGFVGRSAASLSPGERTRVSLALLQARGVNLLVLDEPTNHLDLEAIEQLEQALETFDGTVLLVTHDRRMLDTVRLTRRWHVEGGKVVEIAAD